MKVYKVNLTEQDLDALIRLAQEATCDEILASLQEQKEMQDAPDDEQPMDMYGKVL